MKKFRLTFASFISSGFGLGFLPGAPGTWGSLLGIPLGLWFLQFPIYLSVLFCFLLALLMSPLVKRATLELNHEDAQQIVIDEIIGQALAIQSLKRLSLAGPQTLPISYIIWAFILFRIFDIFKPFPANLLDRQKSLLGLFGDDIVAGLYAAIIIKGLIKIFPAI
jgi:phosphatidylglycerophosphatase A